VVFLGGTPGGIQEREDRLDVGRFTKDGGAIAVDEDLGERG
jgi:hypothetical protein